jgi:nitroreductase
MPQPEIVRLPPPRFEGPISIEQALLSRRSVRTFSRDPLTVDDLTQLLWAAQGITHSQGYRTAPSAGALYPLCSAGRAAGDDNRR